MVIINDLAGSKGVVELFSIKSRETGAASSTVNYKTHVLKYVY
jgi:hypothetical protein